MRLVWETTQHFVVLTDVDTGEVYDKQWVDCVLNVTTLLPVTQKEESNLLLLEIGVYSRNEYGDLTFVSPPTYSLSYTKGYAAMVENTTGVERVKLPLAHRLSDGFSKPSLAQLEQSEKYAAGEIVAPPTRTKKVIDNPHGKELLSYQLRSNSKFRDCVYVIVNNMDSLRNQQNGKFNFNFNDLCRILVCDKFTSDHLFSDERGTRYTIAAFRKSVESITSVCRKEFGRNGNAEQNNS